MATLPKESQELRDKLRDAHVARPPMSDDETVMAPVNGAKILAGLDIRPIQPPPFIKRPAATPAQRTRKERTSMPGAADAPPKPADREADAPEEQAEAHAREVFGADNRSICTPTTVFPSRAVCRLVVRFPLDPPGKAHAGTGSLIGGRHVLTAGHVLFNAALGGWTTSIRVVPAQDGDVWPYGSEEMTWPNYKQRSVEGWTEDGDSDYDYGLITLNKGFSVGTFGLLYLSDDDLDATTAYMIGYPGERPKNSTNMGKQQYSVTAGGALTDYDSTMVFYAMDTSKGQSGAGVYRFWKGKRAIFAVHGGQYDGNENRAARITKKRHDLIRGWQEADK